MTSEEVMFHIPWKPYCLIQHVEISFNKPPIKRSSDWFWLWTNTSYLLDLHATSHDTAPPRNLKLAASATAAKGSSFTLDFAAKFDLFFKTSAICGANDNACGQKLELNSCFERCESCVTYHVKL